MHGLTRAARHILAGLAVAVSLGVSACADLEGRGASQSNPLLTREIMSQRTGGSNR